MHYKRGQADFLGETYPEGFRKRTILDLMDFIKPCVLFVANYFEVS